MDQRIYIDLEYMYPGMTRERGRPTDKDLRQVVQIAAILFDNLSGSEIESFEVLTWPSYTKALPPFFVELTNISEDDLTEKGMSFEEGLRKLIQFVRRYPLYTFDQDEAVLRQNCSYVYVKYPFDNRPFIRIKPKLPSWGLESGAYSSGTLYQSVGLNLSGHVHNALHDVRSMAHAVHLLEKRALFTP
jgi:inhibitor of KinA sporulation pathway (predicted exonuclease)